MSNLAIEGSQEHASAPVTADTSMTDPPSQPATKVAREREDDDVDEPSAKRARTEDREAVNEEPAPQIPTAAPEAAPSEMPVEQEVDRTIPPRTRPSGQPGSLGDTAEEDKPISTFANREIRRVLASIKKTKAGGVFKDPVSTKWPALWQQYLAKIEKPVDIGSMEKTLRDSSYATLGDFVNDVFLIKENAITFNGNVHEVTGWAITVVDNIFARLAEIPAQEPARPSKKESKQIATRHAEPRAAAQPRRESRGAAASPVEEIAESPVFAIPPSGVPIIRRDSTKNDGDRPKRPIHPPKNKDLGYDMKNLKKKKLSPELRFCDEVLKELQKNRHWEANQWFMQPVDPVRDSAPDYHKVIKKPMDLSTMGEKLARGEYNSAKDFKDDFKLITKNCQKYNAAPSQVRDASYKLDKLFTDKFNEMGDWLAGHAPPPAPSAASPSGAAKDDTDEEDEASEAEEEDEAPVTSETLNMLTSRLTEEQNRLTAYLNAKVPDTAMITTQQGLLNMIMGSIVDEKKKLNEAAPKKAAKPAKPTKPSKAKKAAGSAPAAGGSKKAAAATGGGGGGKKNAGGGKKAAKGRIMGQAEKNVVAEGINSLEGNQLERAIEIIKKDTHQEESADGELELDIDQLSQEALAKLYDLVIRSFPSMKPKEKSKPEPAPAPAAETPAHHLGKSAKPKKHKPMGKAEQERSIEKLREIKAQFQRPGSGSQEPLPSVEGQAPARDEDSDEESEADSEED